jgi:hypothetical protein
MRNSQNTRTKSPRVMASSEPEAFFAELSTGMAIVAKGISIGKDVAKGLQSKTILEISVLDSYAAHGKHHVDLSFKNTGDQGMYIESLTVHRPGEDNKEFSILKGAGMDVAFTTSRESRMSLDATPTEPDTTQPFFPKKLVQGIPFKFKMVFKLESRESMLAKPYLVAKLICSKLDEQKLRPHHFHFQLRWD